MAALALAAAAFQNMCRQLDWLRENLREGPAADVDRIGTRLCALVAQALGAFGTSGGQLLEMTPEDWASVGAGAPPPSLAPERIALLKTAPLFELATGAGWLVAGGEGEKLPRLAAAGRHLGLAYQIADDLGDAAADAARATPARPDANYANRSGREAAQAALERELGRAARLLRREGLWTPLWEDEIYPAFRAMATAAGTSPAADDSSPATVAAAAAATVAAAAAVAAAATVAAAAAPGANCGALAASCPSRAGVP
jgi:hypothetical protein